MLQTYYGRIKVMLQVVEIQHAVLKIVNLSKAVIPHQIIYLVGDLCIGWSNRLVFLSLLLELFAVETSTHQNDSLGGLYILAMSMDENTVLRRSTGISIFLCAAIAAASAPSNAYTPFILLPSF